MKNSVTKSVLLILLCLVLVFSMAACGNSTPTPPTTTPEVSVGDDAGTDGGDDTGTEGNSGLGEAIGNFFSNATKSLEGAGRPTDSVNRGQVGNTLDNVFFSWKVTAIEAAETINGDYPGTSGYKFVRADIEVINIVDEALPVGNYDFFIIYEDEDGETVEDYAYEEFADGMYPDEVEISPGESLTGFLVFEVPEYVNEALLTYYEDYEDGFRGETHYFEASF
jgi:predicted small lipoprotein YifL